MLDEGVIAVLLVVSNLIYLVPAVIAWYVRYFELLAYLVAVCFVSAMHHLCHDGGICFGVPPDVYAKSDTAFALIAVGITSISFAIYELIPKERMARLVHRGYTVRSYPMTLGTGPSKNAHPDSPEYVLVKHTYADLFITFYVILMIITTFAMGDENLIVFAVAAIYAVLVIAFHWGLYWRFKKRLGVIRYYWPAIVLSVIFAVVSVIIFKILEDRRGRVLHTIWHVTGAMTCASFLIGTTAFFV
jgi:hypothetical protein